MTMHKLTDLQIKVRIVPTRVRWPEAHASPAWTKAHGCVHALEDLVRRRRFEIGEQALSKLVNFTAFEIAAKALSENTAALERLNDRDPEQVQMLQKLKQGLRDLQKGMGSGPKKSS